MMKVSSVWMCCMLMAANLLLAKEVRSQKMERVKVRLGCKDEPLESAFRKIEGQTEFRFAYREDQLNAFGKVSLKLETRTVRQTLEFLLAGTTLDFQESNGNIIIFPRKGMPPVKSTFPSLTVPASPSEIDADTSLTIRGKVTDKDGLPLAGVSVIIKGTSRGAATNDKGLFEVKEVAANAQLLISHVGYERLDIQVNGRNTLDLRLTEKPETSKLNEVVVVGYGRQRKLDLTGAVEQVSGEVLQNRPIANVAQGLQGVIPNLNITTDYTGGGAPGAAMNINIRGYTGTGYNGASTTDGPLVLVDGVQGDINTLNPLDIESVSVLKDAASSAIYGSRAPYGVILVTTKKGKNQKPRLTLSANTSFSHPTHLPDEMNSLQTATLWNEAAANSGIPAVYSDATIARIEAYLKDPVNTPTTVPDPGAPNTWGGWGVGNSNNNWFKIYFKDVVNQQYNASITGGNEKLTYYMGLGYNERSGLFNFGNDKYQRYNLRANITAEATNWLSLSLRTAISSGNTNTPNTYAGKTGGNYMHQFARKTPTLPLKDPDGVYSAVSEVLDHLGGRTIDKLNNISLTGEAVAKPLPGWEITGSYNVNYLVEDYQTENKTVYSTNVDGTPVAAVPVPDQVSKFVNLTTYYTANLYTSYEKNLGHHYFKVLVGYQTELNQYKNLSGTNSYLYTGDVPALSLTYGTSPSLSDVMNEWATEGVFARFNYNFNDKYLLEFNGRTDGSSRFAPGHRWGFFPSVSAGYNVFKEKFWEPVKKYVNTLKFRGSYGVLGDNNVSNYLYVSTLNTAAPNASNWIFNGSQKLPFVRQATTLVSPDITWAKPAMLDFGADAGFLQSRLSLTYDWYKRKTTDMIGPAQSYPAVLGATAPSENNTSIETRGMELSLGWQDNWGKVHYHARFTLSNYKASILKYPNPTKILSNYYSGMKMGEIWGYQTLGLFQTTAEVAGSPSQAKVQAGNYYPGDVKYKDLNHDGIISPGSSTFSDPGDRKVIGNSTPQYAYGFTFGASWKGFDFSAFIQGIAKRDIFVNSNYFWGIIGDPTQSTALKQILNHWTPGTPNGYFPRYYMTNSETQKNEQVQTRYLQNGAYARLKNVQVGYTLPNVLVKRAGIQSLYIYASAENMLTITKLQKSMDPETAISDAKVYPLQRTLSVGINLGL